ncbi:MAG: hypothetical protein ACFFEN_14975 [Candidatus Thorarchaeota archaeon]
MDELNKIDKKFRNISLILLFFAVLILIIWIVWFFIYPLKGNQILLAVGIALLLAGILLFTRIQYVIWLKKRY